MTIDERNPPMLGRTPDSPAVLTGKHLDTGSSWDTLTAVLTTVTHCLVLKVNYRCQLNANSESDTSSIDVGKLKDRQSLH